MKEIEEFKKNNGDYVKYSTKELIAGLHTKIDIINTRLLNGEKKFAAIETTTSVHKKLLIGIYGSLGALLMLILRLTKVI